MKNEEQKVVEEAEEKITVEEVEELEGTNIEALLDGWCGVKGTKFLYLKKEGNHLIVGKATVEYKKAEEEHVFNAKVHCLV